MRKIINLTQHHATGDQVEAGVLNPFEEDQEAIRELLTFDEIPSAKDLQDRANELTALAKSLCRRNDTIYVMIGGAPFFMPVLERTLKERGLHPVYAFSKREVVEEPQPDGTVIKKAVFKHLGFVGF